MDQPAPGPRRPKLCRVCRAPDNDDLITVQLVQEGVSVATMFLELTGIQVTADRNLPQNVCLACLERLRSAHLLRRQCLESDQLLRSELPVAPPNLPVAPQLAPREETPPPPTPQLEESKGMFKLEIETLEIESEPEEVVGEEEEENELKFIVESVDEVEEVEEEEEEEEDDQTIDILTSEELPNEQVKQPDLMYLNSYDESDYEIVFQGEHYDRIKFVVARCCGCSKRFPSKTDLLEHGQLVHKEKHQKPAKRSFPHECPVCFRQFASKRAIGAHRDQIDTDWFHCRECDLLVHSQRQIVGHLERVHGITELGGESDEEEGGDVPALTLGAFDPSQYELTRTEFGFDLVEFRRWRCCGCSASFELREDFEQHSRDQHMPERTEEDGERRPYECNVCYRRFEKRASLTIHKNRPKKRSLVCRICEGIFRGETTYRKHARKEHGIVTGADDRLPLPNPQLTLSQIVLNPDDQDLRPAPSRTTLATITPSSRVAEQPEVTTGGDDDGCDETPDEVDLRQSPGANNRHVATPTSLPQEGAGGLLTDKEPAEDAHLVERVLQMLVPNQPVNLQALSSRLDFIFGFDTYMAAALSRNAGITPTPEMPPKGDGGKKYKCDYPDCDYSARKPFLVKRHRQKHSEEKSHVCPHCNVGFKFKETLTNHIPLCLNERPYVCSLCQESFHQRGSLFHHKKTKHSKEK